MAYQSIDFRISGEQQWSSFPPKRTQPFLFCLCSGAIPLAINGRDNMAFAMLNFYKIIPSPFAFSMSPFPDYYSHHRFDQQTNQ